MLSHIDFKNIKGVTSDSRQIKEGGCFVAIKGSNFDGHDYIEEALRKGVALVISQKEHNDKRVICHPNTRYALSYIASKLYPKQPRHTVAVTGTNGKTSISFFYKQIMDLLGYKSCYLGTIGASGYTLLEVLLTTPDAVFIHKLLDRMAEDNVDSICMEASSIGIEQDRVSNVKFTAAAFTNFTQDHLDYHDNIENYFKAKSLLFSKVMKDGTAVLNSDIPEFGDLVGICKNKHRILSYGRAIDADLRIVNTISDSAYQIVEFTYQGEKYKFKTNIISEFQVYNILCAIGLVLTAGSNIKEIVSVIEHVQAPPGRMEIVSAKDNKVCIVDYAHTPDALEKALATLRPITKGRLIVVFGCGGNRDKKKRAIMGEVAGRLADVVVLADDNPRYEDPVQIRDEILVACPQAINIGDRYKAIEYSLKEMQEGDCVLVAGKGHEENQITGDKSIRFSDREVIKKITSHL